MLHQPKSLMNVKIHDISLAEAISHSDAWLRSGGFHHVVTPGPEFLLEASQHQRFQSILNRADMAIPDGFGLKVGFALQGQRLRHRVAGADYVEELLDLAAQQHRSVFLFGSQPGIGERAAQNILKKYQGITISGVESGYRWPWTRLKNHQVVARIHRVKPDILLVALGAPKQELWIDTHRQALHDVKIAVGVGRTLDYLAGEIQRAPRILRRLGLEWTMTWLQAYKYHQGPFRRQRIYNATWHFIRAVLSQPWHA